MPGAAPDAAAPAGTLPSDRAAARATLVRALQLAYSGELGAIRAYLGHSAALRGRPERAGLRTILVDEIRHRRRVGEMLAGLGAAPDPAAERKLDRIGRTIAWICCWSGWFVPMYGAARLERDNVAEYEVAARLAWWAGERHLEDDLLHLAEVEWDHERWLREQAARHLLWHVAPYGRVPPPREEIRARFRAFLAAPTPVEPRRSLLFR
jgi:hypothetical protein